MRWRTALLLALLTLVICAASVHAQVCATTETFTNNDLSNPDRAFFAPAQGQTVLVAGAGILGVADSGVAGMIRVAPVLKTGSALNNLDYLVEAPAGQVFGMNTAYKDPALQAIGPNVTVFVTLTERGGVRVGQRISIIGCSVALGSA